MNPFHLQLGPLGSTVATGVLECLSELLLFEFLLLFKVPHHGWRKHGEFHLSDFEPTCEATIDLGFLYNLNYGNRYKTR